jgi:hypothetical protein
VSSILFRSTDEASGGFSVHSTQCAAERRNHSVIPAKLAAISPEANQPSPQSVGESVPSPVADQVNLARRHLGFSIV